MLNSIKNIHPEYQYLNLIKNILNNGEKKIGRNGTTFSLFGTQMRFSLKNNVISKIVLENEQDTRKSHPKIFFLRREFIFEFQAFYILTETK